MLKECVAFALTKDDYNNLSKSLKKAGIVHSRIETKNEIKKYCEDKPEILEACELYTDYIIMRIHGSKKYSLMQSFGLIMNSFEKSGLLMDEESESSIVEIENIKYEYSGCYFYKNEHPILYGYVRFKAIN